MTFQVITHNAEDRQSLADSCNVLGLSYRATSQEFRNAYPETLHYRLGRVVYEIREQTEEEA